jgi:predicted TIM-barrel fold metal-dependent hydrolase
MGRRNGTMTQQYRIVSADGHNLEPPHIWDIYLPKRFAEHAPRLVKDPEGGDAWEFIRGADPMPIGLVTNAGIWGRRYEENEWFGETYDNIRQGAFNGQARLEEQDIDGIDGEVIFPSQRTMQVFMSQPDDDLHIAGVEAYNTWLREEFCAADPSRLIGLAQMPAIGTAAAVKAAEEARRAGFKGVIITSFPSGNSVVSRDDDPFWEAVEALELPVHIHAKVGPAGKKAAAAATPSTFLGKVSLELMGGAVAGVSDTVARMIYSEMFDRFPKLKIVLAECGAGWVPHFLEHMDDLWWRNRVWTESGLKMTPSQYFRRNFMCTFIREPFAVHNRHAIGVDNMMWSNDYPHHKNDWPYSRRVIEDSFVNVPAVEKAKMICGNAVRLYRLDMTRDRDGKPEELGSSAATAAQQVARQ